MSIVKRIIIVPSEIEVVVNSGKIQIRSSQGVLTQEIPPQVKIIQKANTLLTTVDDPKHLALAGTINSLIFSMLRKEPYQEILHVKGVGYKVSLKKEENKGNYLEFSLGYSHLISLSVPSGLEVTCPNNNKLIIQGTSKQQVGWFAAKIRDFRQPSVYKKNKGIYYSGEAESIKIKSGKTVNK